MDVDVSNRICDLLQSVVVFPLTAGNKSTGSRCHDGRIATIVVVGCIFAISTVIMLFNFSQPLTTVTFDMVYFLISVLDILALSSMMILCGISRQRNTRWLFQVPSQIHESYLKIRFIWLFGLLCIACSSIKFARNIYCLTSLSSVDSTVKSYVTKNVYWNISTIFYILMQVGFISYFSKFKFRGSLGIHYGMILIVASNMLVWIFSFLHESEHLFHVHYNNTVGVLKTSTPPRLPDCHGNSTLYIFFTRIHPYVYPAYIEYSLLAVSCILGMWSSTDIENNINSQNETTYEPINDESTSLLESSHEVATGHRYQSHSLPFYVTLIVGTLLNLPLIIGSLFLVSDLDEATAIYFPFEIYKLLFSIILLLTNMAAFHKLRKECHFTSILSSLHGNEFVLLFSTFADVIYRTFGLLAGAFRKDQNSAAVVGFNVANIMIDYLQTTFIMQAHRYKKNRSTNSVLSIENICLMMTLLNFGSWIVESLAGIRFQNLAMEEVKFYTEEFWYHVIHIVGPVAIFYRFHAFIDCHILYRYFGYI